MANNQSWTAAPAPARKGPVDFFLVTEEQLPPHVRAKLAARDRREWQQEERRRARNARRRAAYDQARDDAAEVIEVPR